MCVCVVLLQFSYLLKNKSYFRPIYLIDKFNVVECPRDMLLPVDTYIVAAKNTHLALFCVLKLIRQNKAACQEDVKLLNTQGIKPLTTALDNLATP